MPSVKDDYVLQGNELGYPILWIAEPLELPNPLDLSDAALEPVFGEGRGRRLKSWAHDDDGVHWLATRSGTALHMDKTYIRYTHHMVLRNDGWRIRGLYDDDDLPEMVPGTIYCLDTHSPHQVVPDDRLLSPGQRPLYKLQIVVDSENPLDYESALDLLWPWTSRELSDFDGSVTFTAPTRKFREHESQSAVAPTTSPTS